MQAIGETMQTYKQKLIIWLLKQLGIEESHIKVVVGELTMQERKLQMQIEATERYMSLLDKVYGKFEPIDEPDDVQTYPRAYVYFIANREQNAVKIGYSASPSARLSNLQTSTPSKLELLATIEGDMQTERQLHHRFAEYRVSGEWFRLADDLVEFIESIK